MQDGSALAAAIGVFVVQYIVLFTVLMGIAALVKWTFSGQPM